MHGSNHTHKLTFSHCSLLYKFAVFVIVFNILRVRYLTVQIHTAISSDVLQTSSNLSAPLDYRILSHGKKLAWYLQAI